jgi:glucokinase
MKALANDLDLKAPHLKNDLEAVAGAVPPLCTEDMITINQGEPVANGPIAIIAPATGLGESFLTWNGSEYVVRGSRKRSRHSGLKVLAAGGVYLADGIALHLVELQEPQFVQTFARKSLVKDLIERTPIHIIATRTAVLGAAVFGLQSLGHVENRAGTKAPLAPVSFA